MADLSLSTALSTLIGSIYDCVFDPSLWRETLAKMRDAINCRTATITLSDPRNARMLLDLSVGIEPSWIERAEQHAPEIHSRLTEYLASGPSLDAPHIISRHVTPAAYNESRYIQECLLPGGIVDVMLYFIMVEPNRLAGLGFGRHQSQGPITDKEVEIGGLLLPHVRRAVTISNLLDLRTIERSRMAEILDGLRCGVVLADERGGILHANQSGLAELDRARLVRSVGGALQATTANNTAALLKAIKLAAQGDMAIGGAGLSIRLDDRDATAGDHRTPVFAYVLPLTGSDLRTRLRPTAVAAVFIGTSIDEQRGADATADTFGLTPAESRVLASLLRGATMAETATTLGIAPSTAKTHLERIFSKTGVTRQAELMRLATSLIPPVERGRL